MKEKKLFSSDSLAFIIAIVIVALIIGAFIWKDRLDERAEIYPVSRKAKNECMALLTSWLESYNGEASDAEAIDYVLNQYICTAEDVADAGYLDSFVPNREDISYSEYFNYLKENKGYEFTAKSSAPDDGEHSVLLHCTSPDGSLMLALEFIANVQADSLEYQSVVLHKEGEALYMSSEDPYLFGKYDGHFEIRGDRTQEWLTASLLSAMNGFMGALDTEGLYFTDVREK